ncbi:MAG: type IV pilus assembly protein PilM [Thermodesulfobacteriota bacterium]|nr:type IV pilus assembly protein PilM [Thermodesulfobacteriota bacterium]
MMLKTLIIAGRREAMFLTKDIFSIEKKIVGVDIGSSLIKLVELEDTPRGYVLRGFAQIPLEKGVIEDGQVVNPSALTHTIKDLTKLSKITTKNVATALSGHFAIVKKATFRAMEEDELRDLIVDEADEYLPFDDIGKVNFDLHILGENTLNTEQIDVIIAAAEKRIIKSYTSPIEKAGYSVAIVDVDSFALETAYEENYEFDEEDVVVLVNIGASMTNINVVRGGGSVFTRNIMLGGNAITEALKEKLGVSFEEAEKIKIEGTSEGADVSEELLIYAEPIFMEIERSIDFFISSLGGLNIQKLLVSGGCAKIKGLVDILRDRLRADVEIMNPFQKISYDEKSFSSSYIESIGTTAALAVGLALRRMDDK